MGGKARVHVLAKELSVPAKTVLQWLSEHGEFMKSASSTVPAPVARRLRETFNEWAQDKGDVVRRSPATASPTPTPPSTSIARPAEPERPQRIAPLPHPNLPQQVRRLTPKQEANICKRFRQAYTSGNHDRAALEKLYLEYEVKYRVPRRIVRNVVANDGRLHPGEYRTPQHAPRATPRPASHPAADPAMPQSTDAARPAPPKPTAKPAVRGRPRPRTADLPPVRDVANPDSVADLIMSLDPSLIDRDEIIARVRDFTPDAAGNYGYLAWRYSAAHRRTYPTLATQTPHHDLAIMAQVVETETELLTQLTPAHRNILDQPTLVQQMLDTKYANLTDPGDFGSSAADELRRVRARDKYLRDALMLTIADPDADHRLWNRLHRLRPSAPDRLVDTNHQLKSTTTRLADLHADTEMLLTAAEIPLHRYFAASQQHLHALQAGRYDFLRKFADIEPSAARKSRRAIEALPFEVLPRGEKLRAFLDRIRRSGLYRGYVADDQRIAVLEDIEKHFGVDRCEWHEGTQSSGGVNNQYLILTIKADNAFGEHAVAISPLAGLHATFVVRADCVDTPWKAVFAKSKSEAIALGALRFRFTTTDTGPDPYCAMGDKVITILEGPRDDYLKRTARH
ncbi:hypothetical protein [Mycolicibacterium llatzerense]|uniref:hypothetical protein n=1 Tax=Mycolicibacterium llatzerense TaxID=280871 RepID=UPI0039B7912A